MVSFSDLVLHKEIAGTYASNINSGKVDYVHIGATQNNTYDKSYSTPNVYSARPDLLNKIELVGQWHTHPSYADWNSRSVPSNQDMNFRSKHPQVPHFILTMNKSYSAYEKISY